MRGSFVAAAFLLLSTLSWSQSANTRISLSLIEVPLEVVLDSVSRQTNYFFSYNSDLVPDERLFSCEAEEESLIDFLDKLFGGTGISYSFSRDQIVLKRIYDTRPPSQSGLSNFTLYGWAKDEETGEFIPGVNVYLNGTSIGSVTNINGFYRFENIPYGQYTLIFSHVSYEKFYFEFNVREEGSAVVSGDLEPKLNELSTVEISSTRWVPLSEEKRHRALTLFRKEFLGETSNSSRCKILNESKINFYTDPAEDTLFAEAEAPLRIRNESLGYMIIYELEYFRNHKEGIAYSGNVRFEQMPVLDDRLVKEWSKNRRKAYEGSLRHFLKALVDNKLKREGFQIYLSKDLIYANSELPGPIRRNRIISYQNRGEWKLEFEDYLFVEFSKEKESERYLTRMRQDILQRAVLSSENLLFLSRKPAEQRSMLKLKESFVNIDANGHILEPLAVSTVGYWAWERFADLLPIDYDPKNDKIR